MLAPDSPQQRVALTTNIHEGYWYYTILDEQGYNIYRRRNLETGVESSPCLDPLCTHTDIDCPFFCGKMLFTPLFFGDWMMVQSKFPSNVIESGPNTSIKRVLYNLKTGEWREALVIEDATAAHDSNFYYGNGCIYNAICGKAQTDPQGKTIIPCEIRAHELETGKEWVIESFTYYVRVFAISSNRLYYSYTLPQDDNTDAHYYSSIDIETKEIREEPNFKLSGVNYIYQNKLYNVDLDLGAVVVNDVTDGSVYRLTNPELGDERGDVIAMSMTKDALYYIVKKGYSTYDSTMRVLYEEFFALPAEEKLTKRNEFETACKRVQAEYDRSTAQLWCLPFDESEPQLFIEVPGFRDATFLVSGEYMYARNLFFDTQTGELLDPERVNLVCRIHLKTGEVEVVG